MSNNIATLEKLLAKTTVDKLDSALTKGNMESLKKQMEKLFTFKNIFNLHDDHLTELAECIVDLSRADDRMETARAYEVYARSRIFRYQERKKSITNEKEWAKAAKNKNEIEQLDLDYRVWVYESGFEHSKFQMYMMLCSITEEIIKTGEPISNGAKKY